MQNGAPRHSGDRTRYRVAWADAGRWNRRSPGALVRSRFLLSEQNWAKQVNLLVPPSGLGLILMGVNTPAVLKTCQTAA